MKAFPEREEVLCGPSHQTNARTNTSTAVRIQPKHPLKRFLSFTLFLHVSCVSLEDVWTALSAKSAVAMSAPQSAV